MLVLKIEQAHQVGPLHLHLHLQQHRQHYQYRNKFLPAQYLCEEEEEEQTDGQDRTGASISEQVVIYLRRKHLTFITDKTVRQTNEKL